MNYFHLCVHIVFYMIDTMLLNNRHKQSSFHLLFLLTVSLLLSVSLLTQCVVATTSTASINVSNNDNDVYEYYDGSVHSSSQENPLPFQNITTQFLTDTSIKQLRESLASTTNTKVVHVQIGIPHSWIQSSHSIRYLQHMDSDTNQSFQFLLDDNNSNSNGNHNNDQNNMENEEWTTTSTTTSTSQSVSQSRLRQSSRLSPLLSSSYDPTRTYYLQVKLAVNATLMWMLPYSRLYTLGSIDSKMSFVRLALRDNITVLTTTTTTSTTSSSGSNSHNNGNMHRNETATYDGRLLSLDSFLEFYDLHLFVTSAVFNAILSMDQSKTSQSKWHVCFAEPHKIFVWPDSYYCYVKGDFKLQTSSASFISSVTKAEHTVTLTTLPTTTTTPITTGDDKKQSHRTIIVFDHHTGGGSNTGGDNSNSATQFVYEFKMSGYLMFTMITFGVMSHVIVAYTFYFVLRKLNFIKKISQQMARHGELHVTNSFYEPPFFPNIFPRLASLKLRADFRFWEGFVLLCFHGLMYALITLTAFTPLTWAGKHEYGGTGGGYIATNYLWLKLPALFSVIGINLACTLFKILMASDREYRDSFQTLFSIGNMIVFRYKQQQQMNIWRRQQQKQRSEQQRRDLEMEQQEEKMLMRRMMEQRKTKPHENGDDATEDDLIDDVDDNQLETEYDFENEEESSEDEGGPIEENYHVISNIVRTELSTNRRRYGNQQTLSVLSSTSLQEPLIDPQSQDTDFMEQSSKLVQKSPQLQPQQQNQQHDHGKASHDTSRQHKPIVSGGDDESIMEMTHGSSFYNINSSSFSISNSVMKLQTRNKLKNRGYISFTLILVFKILMGFLFGLVIVSSVGTVSFFVYRPFVQPFLRSELPCFLIGLLVLGGIFIRYPFRTYFRHVSTLLFKDCILMADRHKNKKKQHGRIPTRNHDKVNWEQGARRSSEEEFNDDLESENGDQQHSMFSISDTYALPWHHRLSQAFKFTLGTIVVDVCWIWTLYLLALNIGVVISRAMFSTITNLVVDTSTVPMYSYMLTLLTTMYTFIVETKKPFVGVKDMMYQSREPAQMAVIKTVNEKLLTMSPEDFRKRLEEKDIGYSRTVVYRTPMTWRAFLTVCEMAHVETLAQSKISQMAITLVVLCTLFLGVSVFDVNFFGGKNSQMFTVLGGSILPLIPVCIPG